MTTSYEVHTSADRITAETDRAAVSSHYVISIPSTLSASLCTAVCSSDQPALRAEMSSTDEPGCGEEQCDVKQINAGEQFITSSPSFNSPTIELPPHWSSLLYFDLPHDYSPPIWLSAHVMCHGDDGSDTLVSLLQWTATAAVSNQTDEQGRQAVIGMSLYNATSSYIDSLTANPRLLNIQRSVGPDSLLVSSLTAAGYYGLLLTNMNDSASHNFTVNLSSFSSRPIVSLDSPFSLPFLPSSLGLFFLFLLLSSLCLGCLILGRRYLAGFRRKGGKKYHGVNKLPEGDGRGGASSSGGGLDGRVENGDSMEAWDAEMKEMDSLELQLSDEGEQSEFELNEIATIYRQPQPAQPQPPPQPPHAADGSGKRSPASEESKMNGGSNGGERLVASPIRLSGATMEGASRQSPPPIVQPAVQPVVEVQQQRAQPTTTSGKKKRKKRRDEGGEQSEA